MLTFKEEYVNMSIVLKRKASNMKRNSKWREEYAIKIYQMACDGLSMQKIAEALGITVGRINVWKKTKKIVKFALAEAEKRGGGYGGTLMEYIYNRLPEELQATWDKIDAVIDTENGLIRVQKLMDKRGKNAQQHLFLYALTNSHFNPSEACRKIGIPYQRVKRWLEEDVDFAELTDEVHLHKKNFFESQLVRLVAERDPQAVLFVNKTLNKDRGYGEKQEVQVEVKGGISHAHVLQLDERIMDMISVKAQRELLGAIESVKRQDEELTNTIPAISHKVLEKV